MSRINAIGVSKRRLIRLLPFLFGSVIGVSAAGAGQAQSAAAITAPKQEAAQPATYRVINLRPGDLNATPVFNASGQAVFSLYDGTNVRTWFYDGSAIQDIGTFGGPETYANGLNNAGQVAGFSAPDAASPFHAYVWSKDGGMINLGLLPDFSASFASAINNRGQVVGNSAPAFGGPHAFRWTAAGGMEDLGAFTSGLLSTSSAIAVNDSGLVAGFSNDANNDAHAFAWTRKTGMIDLGTLGGSVSYAVAVDAEGRVAGYSTDPGSLNHAFIWSRTSGMKDLGTPAGGSESFVVAMSANGHAAGGINFPKGQHAFSWTRASGLVDLGTLGGDGSNAGGVNNMGQVVGGASTKHGDLHAFVWTAGQGMIDLNKRLRHAPAGIVLDFAVAIADNGWIVATSNAGLVLLKPISPGCGCAGMHTAGPIEAADMVEIGVPFDTSVSFAGSDAAARHNVTWSWGDGSGEQGGNVRAGDGVGSASGSHAYATPGIYTVTANVVDLAGKSAAVSRTIVAVDRSAGFASGRGWFMSPQGANKKSRLAASKASFSFIAPSMAGAMAMAAKPELRFNVPGLSLRSADIRPVVGQGAQGQFEGSGTINGKGDYKFTLDTTAGAAAGQGESARFGLRIWHTDPATKVQVVDYDNTGPGTSGGAVVDGRISLQQP